MIDITNHIRAILDFIGENPNREGLQKTPDRVKRSYSELFSGYAHENGKEILTSALYENENTSYNSVNVCNIEFASMCEHHMLPFTGVVHIGYIPNKHVVGLSKLPRLTEIYSRRLQIQERITNQIAEDIEKFIQPHGVAVLITSKHQCMGIRGVCQNHSNTTSSTFRGIYEENSNYRQEFFEQVKLSCL